MGFFRSALLLVPLTMAACDAGDAAPEPEPIEETHVVLTECGVELACDPMTLILDYQPAEAYECASELWSSGGTGRISILEETDDDAYTTAEYALILLPDGKILEQVRETDLGDLEDESDDRWLAWGEHQLCENINDTFAPEANFECQPVSDWTCDDVLAAIGD